MKKLLKLRGEIHEIHLFIRRIEYLLNTQLFKRLWTGTKEKKKEEFLVNKTLDKNEIKRKLDIIKRWIDNHPDLEIGEYPVWRLKTRAKALGIKNYSRLTKVELIKEIQNETKK